MTLPSMPVDHLQPCCAAACTDAMDTCNHCMPCHHASKAVLPIGHGRDVSSEAKMGKFDGGCVLGREQMISCWRAAGIHRCYLNSTQPALRKRPGGVGDWKGRASVWRTSRSVASLLPHARQTQRDHASSPSKCDIMRQICRCLRQQTVAENRMLNEQRAASTASTLLRV
jgi:hypothetical protein